MGLTITRLEPHGPLSFGGIDGAGSLSETHETPAKILVADKDAPEGFLIPCNYQYWTCDDGRKGESGNLYVPVSEQPVDIRFLRSGYAGLVTTFESESCEGEGFHALIRHLMENPPPDTHYIFYNGVEEELLFQEYWDILGVKIPKKRRKLFVHRFSCLRKLHSEDRFSADMTRWTREEIPNPPNPNMAPQKEEKIQIMDDLSDIVPLEQTEDFPNVESPANPSTAFPLFRE